MSSSSTSSSAQSTAQALMRARMRRTIIAPKFVQKYCYKQVDNLPLGEWTCATLLALDGSGAHFPNPSQWNQINHEPDKLHDMWFFWLMDSMKNAKNVGSLRPTISRRSNPEAYDSLLTLVVKVKYSKPKRASAAEHEACRKFTRCDGTFSKKFNELVQQRRDEIDAEALQKGLGKAVTFAKNAERLVRASDHRLDLDAEYRSFFNTYMPPMHKSYQDNSRLDEPKAFQAPLQMLCERLVESERKMQQFLRGQTQGGGPEGNILASVLNDAEDDDVFQDKMSLAIVPLPKLGYQVSDIESDYRKCGALLCLWTVHDPGIEFNKFIDTLADCIRGRPVLNQVSTGSSSSSGSSAGATRAALASAMAVDILPTYQQLWSDPLHPAGMGNLTQSYYEYAINLNPSLRPEQSETRRKEMLNMHLDDTARSKFHPRQLLSIPNALQRAKRFCNINPDTLLVAHGNNVVKLDGQYKAYLYPDAFWIHPRDLGLSEQLLPHVRQDHEFMEHLRHGTPVEHFLSYTDKYVGIIHESVLSKFRKTGEELELLRATKPPQSDYDRRLSESFRVDGFALRNESLLTYLTPNEFMHVQARVNRDFSKIEQWKPAHAMDTLNEVQNLLKITHRVIENDKGKEEAEEGEEQETASKFKYVCEVDKSKFLERLKVDNDLAERVLEYERYAEMLKLAQETYMNQFATLFRLEGDPRALPIPDTIQAMLKWMKDQKFPHMTSEFEKVDPQFDIFGNSMIKMMNNLRKHAGLVDPRTVLVINGTQNVYNGKRDLKFCFILGGIAGGGKTRHCIKTPSEITMIPDTFVKINASTPAADTTDTSVYDVIRLVDEMPTWFVRLDEAAKNKDLVNKEKVKMTDCQYGKDVFEMMTLPTGESVRTKRAVITDHFYTSVMITNEPIDGEEALASRFFRAVMPRPTFAARLFETRKDKASAESLSNFAKQCQLSQFRVAGTYKADMTGAIRDNCMDVMDDVFEMIFSYLKNGKFIASAVSQRQRDVLGAWLDYCVTAHANTLAFDVRGGEGFKVPLASELGVAHMFRHTQRYRYVTTSQLAFALTLLDTSLIDEKNSVMFRAACDSLGFKWNENVSSYENYCMDVKNKIPWRRIRNPKISDETDPNYWLIDIQYVRLEGDLEQIKESIAQATNGRYGVQEVTGMLRTLTSYYITFDHYLEPQPEAMFAEWHKYTRCPGEEPLPPNNNGEDDMDLGDKKCGDYMPEVYLQTNTDKTVQREEEDVPNKENFKSPAIIIDRVNRCVYFAPSAIRLFCSGVLQKALVYAMMTKAFPDGKLLLGSPMECDRGLLQHMHLTKESIKKACEAFDKENQLNPLTGEWLGDPNVPECEQPVSRSFAGIRMMRPNALTVDDVRMNLKPPIPMSRKEELEYRKRREREMETLKKHDDMSEVIFSFDRHSAMLQHIRCGLALDEPVADPLFVDERYKCMCIAEGESEHANIEYPDKFLEKQKKMQKVMKAQTKYGNWTQGTENAFAEIEKASKAQAKSRERANNNDVEEEVQFMAPNGNDARPPPPQKLRKKGTFYVERRGAGAASASANDPLQNFLNRTAAASMMTTDVTEVGDATSAKEPKRKKQRTGGSKKKSSKKIL